MPPLIDLDRQATEAARWGLDWHALTPYERERYTRQQSVIHAYGSCGSLTKAAANAGVSERTVYHWTADNTLAFNRRMEVAHHAYRGYLEGMVDARLAAQKPGDNPVLLIFRLKAEWPEKYGDRVTLQSTNADAILEKLKELQQGRRKGILVEEPATLQLPAPDDNRQTEDASN